jgi:hypothetical protein
MNRAWIWAALLAAACQADPVPPARHLATTEEAPIAGRLEPATGLAPGQPVTLTLRFTDRRTGQPITRVEPEHGKPLHLIVVSADLGSFAHLHPAPAAAGRFAVALNQTTPDPDNQDAAHAVPRPGPYIAFAELRPAGLDEQVVRLDLDAGKAAAPPPLAPEPRLKAIEGYDVTLGIQHEAGTLAFRFDVRRAGKPVDDWEPWLGMAGHVIVIGAEGRFFRHLHPDDDGSFPLEPPPPGLYRIWGQFKRQGRVLTFPFTVRL